jgi:hypothetical protein
MTEKFLIPFGGFVGPCHHGMALSRVAGGGDGFNIWRIKGEDKAVPVI